MADFFDISKWNEKPWYQTGGSRSKVIVENPENGLQYFFKTSLKKEKIDYKYEFWSEIIASEIGRSLGFNTLKYDIALKGAEMGCLSESMVKEDKNNLNELVKYLTGYDTTYNPKDKYSKTQYTFQLIKQAFQFFELDNFIEDIIKIIVFDSIIGNSDRHQENCGIITEYEKVIEGFIAFLMKKKRNIFNKLLIKIFSLKQITKSKSFRNALVNINLFFPSYFSPFYDNGSSLGRELEDEKIIKMLKDKGMFDAYINRGVSEIHWEGKKLNHFELIEKIYQEYPELISQNVNMVKIKIDEKRIREIIDNIDIMLPDSLEKHKLPNIRKEFIFKLVTLRIEKLIGAIKWS